MWSESWLSFNCTLDGHSVTINIYPSNCCAASKQILWVKYWHVIAKKNDEMPLKLNIAKPNVYVLLHSM